MQTTTRIQTQSTPTSVDSALALPDARQNYLSQLIGTKPHRTNTIKRRFPRPALLAGLRQVQDLHAHRNHVADAAVSVELYNQIRQEHRLPIATAMILIKEWGSWSAACEAAGVPVNRGRGVYTRRWTDQQALEWVAQFLAEGHRTAQQYQQWYADKKHGTGERPPSLPWLRIRFTTWSHALDRALAHAATAHHNR